MAPHNALNVDGVVRLRLAALVLAGTLPAAAAEADTVFVSLEKEGVVAVFDGETGALGPRVPVGRRPRGIVAGAPASGPLFVASSEDDAIRVFSPANPRQLQSVATTKDPKTFAVSPDQSRLYVSNDKQNELVVIDARNAQIIKRVPVGRAPEGVSISPDGRWVISTSEADHQAVWIDTARLEVAARTPVAARPRYSRFSDDGSRLWVSSQDGHCVTVVDSVTRQVIKEIRFSPEGVPENNVGPVGIRIDRQGRFAYIALGRADKVAVVDAQTFAVLRYIPVGRRVWNLEFSPDQRRLYAANGQSGDVSVIALPEGTVVRSVQLGEGPWGIATLPE